MSHEISEIMVNGKRIAEAMYAKRPAWHGLGQVLDDSPDSETAIDAAHLDWRVGKETIQTSQDGRLIDRFFALVRQDTRHVLSVVGREYKPLQNREAFSFLDGLLQDGILKYETAFALRGGEEVCLLARMPSVDYVTPEDATLRYVLLSMSHGYGAIKVMPTAVRVVCANTLAVAVQQGKSERNSLSIHHSGDLQHKLAIAQRYLSLFDSAFTLYNEKAKELLKGYSANQAAEYIATLFPVPAAGTDRQKRNVESRKADVRQAFRSPANTMGTIKGTWWSLFNSVTEMIDHAAPLRQSKNPMTRRENRFSNLMTGSAADFKSEAFRLALEMSV